MAHDRIFRELFEVLRQRKDADPGSSYTAKLMAGGVEKIAGKILEEAEEVRQAAGADDREHLTYEICDLLFHTFVMAAHRDVSLEAIEDELARRFGVSGLTEKAQRSEKPE